MKRARTLKRFAWIPLVIAIGCNQDGLSRFWMQQNWWLKKQTAERPVVSEPMPVAATTTAPAPTAGRNDGTSAAAPGDEASADPKVASLSQEITNYLSRVPAEDPNEKNSPGVDAQADPSTPAISGPPAGAAQAQPATPGDRRLATASRPAVIAVRPGQNASVAPAGIAAQPTPGFPETDPGRVGPRVDSAVMNSPLPTSVKPAMATPSVPATPTRPPRVEIIDVRPATAVKAPADSDQSSASPNQPAIAPNPPPLPSDMTSLIAQLEESVRNHPEQLDDQLRLRLLYLATGQDDKAVAPVQTGDPVQAEFLNALFKTLRSSKNMIIDPTAKDATTLAAVDELRRLLGRQLPVTMPKIALVTRINSFGDYEAINPARFPAGRPIRVFLYTEVYNFRSESTGDGKLHTLLAEKVEIFDSTGKIVWQRTEPKIEDRVSSPRRDFFIPFPINLPSDLPAGDYILKVTIEDKIGATADQQRMTFTVGK